ncbi:MAG TPA: helix-turn-helix transcriptional regulator [Allosphingosinicella sp.]|nr:helix-turn-helix transcriptional regulator [Allosphingosinicella sp.]
MRSRLRVLRAEREWTQEELASATGVSRQAINALETERHDPSLDLAFRIAAAFDLPVEQVFPNPHERNPS